jgi:outer membrane immunogenic protein
MQFSPRWVVGAFGDAQFGEISGSIVNNTVVGFEGREKLRTSYAAGVRLGYLVAPNVLSYVNAGYSGSEWAGTSLGFSAAGFPGPQTTTPSFRRDGWFVGGGVENNLDIFGISAPGWFMKTEYRSAFYDRTTVVDSFVAGNFFALPAGALTGTAISFRPQVQTVSAALVYRFNSAVVAKY